MRATVEMLLSTTLQFPLHHLLPPAAFPPSPVQQSAEKMWKLEMGFSVKLGVKFAGNILVDLVNSGQLISAAAV